MDDDVDTNETIKDMNTIQVLIVANMIVLFVVVVVMLIYIVLHFSKFIKSSTQLSTTTLTTMESPDVLSENT